ncbi:MAG: hypothetical protein AB7K68_08350 [Bacteriovoracia bacterium]
MHALFLSFFLSLAAFTAAHAAELPADIAKVYSYQCETNFLEGEGVNGNELSCTSFQQLGLLSAKFTHYLSHSAAFTNAEKMARDEFYAEGVCNLPVMRMRCSETLPELRFGLAAAPSDLFSVAVSLSPAPGLAPELQGYGSAAVRGKCPSGLELVQAYRAAPKSIHRPLPTNFVNENGRLDDLLVMAPTKKTPRMEITRQRNSISCDEVGDCSMAMFDQPVGFQRVDYKATGPGLCVIPRGSLPADGKNFP